MRDEAALSSKPTDEAYLPSLYEFSYKIIPSLSRYLAKVF